MLYPSFTRGILPRRPQFRIVISASPSWNASCQAVSSRSAISRPPAWASICHAVHRPSRLIYHPILHATSPACSLRKRVAERKRQPRGRQARREYARSVSSVESCLVVSLRLKAGFGAGSDRNDKRTNRLTRDVQPDTRRRLEDQAKRDVTFWNLDAFQIRLAKRTVTPRDASELFSQGVSGRCLRASGDHCPVRELADGL